MKTIQTIILATAVAIIMFGSCSGSQEVIRQKLESAEAEILREEAAKSYISSSAARNNPNDTVHKFVRTANLRFKVKDVIESTYDIENIVNDQGGFVSYTNLTSRLDSKSSAYMSSDSTFVIAYYTVMNTLELKVPDTCLDATLTEISRNIDFLDHRIIKAEDVSLQLFENELTQQRAAQGDDRRGNRREQADRARVENLSLEERIAFSTIVLAIYQDQSVRHEIVANNRDIPKAGLGDKMLAALETGWNMLEGIALFLVRMWALILLAVIVYFIYGRGRNKWCRGGQKQNG